MSDISSTELSPKFKPGEKPGTHQELISAAQTAENDDIEVFPNTKAKPGANYPFRAKVVSKKEKTPILKDGTKGTPQVSIIIEKFGGEKISLGGGTTVRIVNRPHSSI